MNQHSNPSDSMENENRLDPAQQSLAEALRLSFGVLKFFMVVLIALFLFSGVFSVREQEMAVRLRFGRILGLPGQQVLKPGGPYFSLPYPFEQVIVVPVAPQQIQIDRAFWYQPDQASGMGRLGPLNPEKDGSLLTGDAEIIHARWSVTYIVDNPISYLENVKSTTSAQALVRAVSQQGIVWAVAGLTADELIRSQHVDRAVSHSQGILDSLNSGIRITTFSVKEPAYPMTVRSAVQEALNAESIRAKLTDEAQEQWNRILVGTVGEAANQLLAMIDDYELATHDEDDSGLADLERLLDNSFMQLAVMSDDGPVSIGGTVAQRIYEARAYRTQVVAQLRSESEYFSRLLPQFRQNRSIVVSRLWLDTKDRIMTGDIETMYLPRGQIYLELNRDPKVRQERERQQLREAEQDLSTNP